MRRFDRSKGRGHQCIREHSNQRSAKQGILEYTEHIDCDCRSGSGGSDYGISRSKFGEQTANHTHTSPESHSVIISGVAVKQCSAGVLALHLLLGIK
jgi:hypothetical protein